MREMDRKDFDLPFASKFILALSAVMLLMIAVFLISLLAVPAWRDGSEYWSFVATGSALVLTIWGLKNGRRFRDDAITATFTREFLEEKYYGVGRIPWSQVLAVVPEIQTIRGVDYKSLFLRLREPESVFKGVPLYTRVFLPLRSWRSRMLPVYFGAFNGCFDEAVEWIETYKPEIQIQPSDPE